MDGYPFFTYSQYLSGYFSGKVRKIPVDVRCTCPVRDGTLSHTGCAFCNGRSYVPRFVDTSCSVKAQLEAGKRFFARKVAGSAEVHYLAYFQNGCNTYQSCERGRRFFDEALSVPGVDGLVIATRPDCLTDGWLELMEEYTERTFFIVELGLESVSDEALHRVGRGHTVDCSRQAVECLASRGIKVGVHFILGLPGETRQTMLAQPTFLSSLPVVSVKVHQLQILRGSRLATDYETAPGSYRLFTPEAYVELLADYLERLSARIAVDRLVSQSAPLELIAPKWGLKNDDIVRRVVQVLIRRGSKQGSFAS